MFLKIWQLDVNSANLKPPISCKKVFLTWICFPRNEEFTSFPKWGICWVWVWSSKLSRIKMVAKHFTIEGSLLNNSFQTWESVKFIRTLRLAVKLNFWKCFWKNVNWTDLIPANLKSPFSWKNAFLTWICFPRYEQFTSFLKWGIKVF